MYLLERTRLLKPSQDTERHEPVHRIVAEYAAASYLVKRIEDASDRLSLKRVLAIIAPNGVTRTELRGMLGWMAALGREPLQLGMTALGPLRDDFLRLQTPGDDHMTRLRNDHLLVQMLIDMYDHIGAPTLAKKSCPRTSRNFQN